MRTYERNWWWVTQKKHVAFVFITVLMILQFEMKSCIGCVETERMGLLQLKSYLNVSDLKLKSWSIHDRNSNCYLWERINCSDAIGGHIVDLSLSGLKSSTDLKGPLNLSLLHSFPQLQTLDFSSNGFNDFFDHIDGYKSFGRLKKLRTLDFSRNSLNNSVLPFLSAARSLTTLNLSRNTLTGVFPPKGLISFRKLEVLDLGSNTISAFEDGDGLVLPSSLQGLDLQMNRLSLAHNGYSEICRLRYLRELDLSYNGLTSMPFCLSNLTSLRTLDLSANELDQNLSSFISGLPSTLEYLSLLDNNFNGSFVFNSLVNQTRLTVLKLSTNVPNTIIKVQSESSWVPQFQLMLRLQSFIFGSTIPGFLVHQHDLRIVDISYSQLTGAFPHWFVQNNTRLHTLIMHSNSLTKMQLPRLVVHSLQVLDISSNRIRDSIQEDIRIIFPNLIFIKFSDNHFQGTIPASMGKMKRLRTLDLSSNDLSGRLPKTFLTGGNSIVMLKLSNNQLRGEVFPEHANLTNLVWLFLDGNSFSGSLGNGLLNSKYITLLDLSDKSFSGTLPLWIGRMSGLLYLYIGGNQLRGSFPLQLQNLLQLKLIDISHNSFSGSLPRNVDFPYLKELRLQSNGFMGSIPETLFKAEELEVVDLRNNNFSGMILKNINGKRSKLRVLLLRNNSFQSHIPDELCQLIKVGVLDLSHNKFKGDIPSCFSKMSFGAKRYDEFVPADMTAYLFIPFLRNWTYASALGLHANNFDVGYQLKPASIVDFLTKSRYEAYNGLIVRVMYGLDLSSNQLSGEIPAEIGDLQNIRSLNLSSNYLTGSIPYNISKLKDFLESLDLSNNKLDGNIPPQLADLNSLGYFNVSCNYNLSGEIPFKGHLVTFDERSYIGNAHLCGLPTNISCIPEESASKQEEDEEEEEEDDDDVINMVWFYWTCVAVYISTSLALFVFLCIDSRWSREWFYRVNLFIHHLQRFKGCYICK